MLLNHLASLISLAITSFLGRLYNSIDHWRQPSLTTCSDSCLFWGLDVVAEIACHANHTQLLCDSLHLGEAFQKCVDNSCPTSDENDDAVFKFLQLCDKAGTYPAFDFGLDGAAYAARISKRQGVPSGLSEGSSTATFTATGESSPQESTATIAEASVTFTVTTDATSSGTATPTAITISAASGDNTTSDTTTPTTTGASVAIETSVLGDGTGSGQATAIPSSISVASTSSPSSSAPRVPTTLSGPIIHTTPSHLASVTFTSTLPVSTPISATGSTISANSSPTTSPNPHSGLSTSTKSGIGVGVSLGVISLLASAFLIGRYGRKLAVSKANKVGQDSSPPGYEGTEGKDGKLRVGAMPQPWAPELHGDHIPPHSRELHGESKRGELPSS